MAIKLYYRDNLEVLRDTIPSESVVIHHDPPFNDSDALDATRAPMAGAEMTLGRSACPNVTASLNLNGHDQCGGKSVYAIL